MSPKTYTQGIHHVGLTVPDIAQTKAFFVEVLGFEVVGGNPSYPSVFVSDGSTMLTLWQAAEPANAVAFDRKHNIGLHHVALRVMDRATLAALAARLHEHDGVEMEFSPEPLGETGLEHMMCTIPGGLRVEFTAAP